jgi:hypothetical protein
MANKTFKKSAKVAKKAAAKRVAAKPTLLAGLAAPFGEHGDRVVERSRIPRAQFEEPRELRLEPRLGPTIDLLPQQGRH